MRFAIPLISAALLSFTAVAVNANPSAPGGMSVASSPFPVTQVAGRCGRFAHYVPRHRFHGHWVAGRCVADPHHH